MENLPISNAAMNGNKKGKKWQYNADAPCLRANDLKINQRLLWEFSKLKVFLYLRLS